VRLWYISFFFPSLFPSFSTKLIYQSPSRCRVFFFFFFFFFFLRRVPWISRRRLGFMFERLGLDNQRLPHPAGVDRSFFFPSPPFFFLPFVRRFRVGGGIADM